jgi:hypothetical protein
MSLFNDQFALGGYLGGLSWIPPVKPQQSNPDPIRVNRVVLTKNKES